MFRQLRQLVPILTILLTLSACGGGGSGIGPNPPPPPPLPPPPPPPAPVATVTVTPGQAPLVTQQTVQLSAATKDASGNTLSGRVVSWSTSAPAVATVSTAGLVSATGAGSATITASSEGKTGTATVTVSDGALIGQSGGNLDAAGGAVKLVVPAGALAAPTALTVVAEPNPPAPPAGQIPLGGTTYQLGPDGTQFSTPATVTIKYDPAQTPPWAQPEDLRIYRYSGGQWTPLTDIVVDPVARTVSGKTPGFSTFANFATPPNIHINPAPGSVNATVRSVVFSANVSSHPQNLFQYTWSTSGHNGTINTPFNNTAQYSTTAIQIPHGDLDLVGVEVKGQHHPGGSFHLIGKAEVKVNSNLGITYALEPNSYVAEFGQTAAFEAVARNADGSLYQADLEYEWSTTGFHGTMNPATSARSAVSTGTYTAKLPTQQTFNPPRGDKVTAKFWVKRTIVGGTLATGTQITFVWEQLGEAEGFVEVAPKTYIGRFQVVTTPTQAGACVSAVIFAPKVAGTTSYDLKASGFSDPGGFGNQFLKTFSGATGTGIGDVQDAGTEFKIVLAMGCATTSGAITARQNLYATAFAGIVVQSKISP
jgi:hypothetical protein